MRNALKTSLFEGEEGTGTPCIPCTSGSSRPAGSAMPPLLVLLASGDGLSLLRGAAFGQIPRGSGHVRGRPAGASCPSRGPSSALAELREAIRASTKPAGE